MSEGQADEVEYLVELFGSNIGPFTVRLAREAVADEILLACPEEIDNAGFTDSATDSSWAGVDSGPSWCLRSSGNDRGIRHWSEEAVAAFKNRKDTAVIVIVPS